MGKTQLSLTFPHIRTYRKIEAIINYFATMKVFIILCIVIGITASLSEAKEGKKDPKKGVGHSAIQFKREAKEEKKDAKKGVCHKAIQFKREAKEEKKDQEKEVGGLFGKLAGALGAGLNAAGV